MPLVTAPDGTKVKLPSSLNGKDLRREFRIPDNKILTKKGESDKEEVVIKNSDYCSIQDNDQFDTVAGFNRGR